MCLLVFAGHVWKFWFSIDAFTDTPTGLRRECVYVHMVPLFLPRDECSHLHEDFSDIAQHEQRGPYFSQVKAEILGFGFVLCEYE